MATLVKFLVNENHSESDLYAYFPQLKHDDKCKMSYSHIGQHSPVSPEYVRISRKATESEYKDLKKELESIGYKLKICK